MEFRRFRAAAASGDLDRARRILVELRWEELSGGSTSAETAAWLGWLHAIRYVGEETGDPAFESALLEEIIDLRRPDDDPVRVAALMDLSATRIVQRDIRGALAVDSEIYELLGRTRPPHDPDLLAARENLALSLNDAGDPDAALEHLREVHRLLQETRSAEDEDVLKAKENLAVVLHRLAAYGEALQVKEQLLETRSRTLEQDDPRLLRAKLNLAATRQSLRDYEGAFELIEQVHAVRERSLDPSDPIMLDTTHNLATTALKMGESERACELLEEVHAVLEREAPPDDPNLLLAKLSLATASDERGDLVRAFELEQYVYEVRKRQLAETDPVLLRAKENLAMTCLEIGYLDQAYGLMTEVHDVRQREQGENHTDLVACKNNLAAVLKSLGDFEGALALEERVNSVWSDQLSPDNSDLLKAKLSLANTRRELGDLDGAYELERHVHEIWAASLTPADLNLMRVKLDLAQTLALRGDILGARALEESVHSTWAPLLAADHPRLLVVKENLAITRRDTGDVEGAVALLEDVVGHRSEDLSAAHPDRLDSLTNLAIARFEAGDFDGACALSLEVATSLANSVEHPALVPAREARAAAAVALKRLAKARIWAPRPIPSIPMARQYFAALESNRHLATARSLRSVQPGLAADDQVERARARLRTAVDALEEHLALGPAIIEREGDLSEAEWGEIRERAQTEWNQGLADLALVRDARQRELRTLLGVENLAALRIDVDSVSKGLEDGEVAIGIHRLDCWVPAPEDDGEGAPSKPRASRFEGPRYVAYAVTSEGTVEEIDLGSARAIDDQILAWRSTLGAPLKSRGLGETVVPAGDELVEGAKLRRLLFDPLDSRLGLDSASTIYICVDDALHTAPLDALPLSPAGGASGESNPVRRLGDDLRVRPEVSFARLVLPASAAATEPSCSVVGGIDYRAVSIAGSGQAGAVESRVLDAGSAVGQSRRGDWSDLPGTKEETAVVSGLAEEHLGAASTKLEGRDVTVSALESSICGQRFVHIATHGWFMPKSVRSMLDHDPSDVRMGLLGTERTITGFAPLALCGLVLSGANAAESNEELAQRLLTAMELASFDLSACELAVLSACETNVGIARAGQGIQSLQSALHQAGARASLTSLWRVDDYATRDLMRAFYSNLWEKKMGKADALWDAKRQLRERGEPVRHWAGWVLVGDPD